MSNKEEAVSTTREIVRRLGKLKIQDIASKDLEAEAHAKSHGEDVELPAELQEKREMQNLEDQLEGMLGGAGNTGQGQPSGKQEVDECKRQLQLILAQLGMQSLLP